MLISRDIFKIPNAYQWHVRDISSRCVVAIIRHSRSGDYLIVRQTSRVIYEPKFTFTYASLTWSEFGIVDPKVSFISGAISNWTVWKQYKAPCKCGNHAKVSRCELRTYDRWKVLDGVQGTGSTFMKYVISRICHARTAICYSQHT